MHRRTWNTTDCYSTTYILKFYDSTTNNTIWSNTRYSGNTRSSFAIQFKGKQNPNISYYSFNVFPVTYIDSKVLISSGNGSLENPYKFDIN